VGSRAIMDAVVKRKIPSPYRDSNPPIIQPVAQRYTTGLSRIPVQGITLQLSFVTCYSVSLCPPQITWIVLGMNPGLRGENLATNRLS
jgi:hypothetical protein